MGEMYVWSDICEPGNGPRGHFEGECISLWATLTFDQKFVFKSLQQDK